jgi:diguanylate cyclase (GGDEF)-like protein/PAS domain S-box-containing protein
MATAFNTMAERLAEMVEQQEEARRTLRGERDFVDAVVDVAGSLVLVMDRAGRIVRFNRACEMTTGYGFAEVEGLPFGEVFRSYDDAPAATFDNLAAGQFPTAFEQPLMTRDGTRRHIVWSNAALLDENGDLTHLIASGLDITARRAVEIELREAQERFRRAFDNAPIGMCLVGVDARFLQVNRALCEMFGYAEDELLRRSIGDVTHPDQVADSLRAVADMADGRAENYQVEKQYVRADGRALWALVSASVVHNEAGAPSYMVTQIQDNTKRRAAEELLVYRAMHDSLTSLPNRALLMDRLSLEVERSRRSLSLTAVLFIDLDGFKAINDSLGHEAGDQVLMEVSRRLLISVRPSDTVARLGGDEFVILCPDVETEQNVLTISNRVAEAVAVPIQLGAMDAVVTASIGIALDLGAQQTPEDLLRDADIAMYSAKARGKNGSVIFDSSQRQCAETD